MSLKDRILSIIEFYNLNSNKFSEQIGMSRGFVKGIKEEIGSKAMRNILTQFPDINLYWLLTGEGEMFNSTTDTQNCEKHPASEHPDRDVLLAQLIKDNGDLREQIGMLKRDLELAHQRKGNYTIDAPIRNIAEPDVDYNKSND